jgi:hypothetical protein
MTTIKFFITLSKHAQLDMNVIQLELFKLLRILKFLINTSKHTIRH